MDIEKIRDDFPITKQEFNLLGTEEKRPLIYLDHGASTHPCQTVIDSHKKFLEKYYSNIHRGNHNLSFIASDLFDQVPNVIAEFIGASLEGNTILMTMNTTSALDMASYMMRDFEGDYLISKMEHHSNDLPHRRNGRVHFIELEGDGSLDMTDLEAKLKSHRIKLVAVTGASNVSGYMPDIHGIARIAHENGARILVDAAQLLAHYPINVRQNDDPEHIDFLAAAGHKAYAPFGSAFLFAPRDIADAVPPYVPGGGTISFVSLDESIWALSPERHEGGTPNIAGAIAFSLSLKYLMKIGMDEIRQHELELLEYTLPRMKAIEGLTVYGPEIMERRLGVLSFNFDNISHEMVAAILNNEAAIATRNGCFCAHPYLHFLLKIEDPQSYKSSAVAGDKFGLPGAVRATIGIYNSREEMDRLIDMLEKIARREWIGEYDIAESEYCRPVYVKLASPGCC